MANESWYYAQGDQQAGPVPTERLRELAATGQLTGDTLVWTKGMGEWSPAGTIPNLLPAATMAIPTNPVSGLEPGGAGPNVYPAGAQAVGYAAAATAMHGGGLNYYAPDNNGPMYAGFWLRFVAVIIDGFIIGIPLAAILLMTSILFSTAVGPTGITFVSHHPIYFTFSRLFTLGVAWLYFAGMESSAKQATLGKLAMSLKVTDQNGARLSFGHATGRYFAKFLSNLTCWVGYIMAGFTARKQALHDMVAKTLVIRK